MFYFASLLSAILAMKTKENSLTLPLTLTLLEFALFAGKTRERLSRLLPFFLVSLIMPLTLLISGGDSGETLGRLESATRHYSNMPRGHYFLTQLNVLVSYIGLIFLPVNQNFDYGFFIYDSFFAPQVLLSSAFHLLLISSGVYLFVRSSRGNPVLRLPAIGIFWFYITIFIESSFFPIPLIMCEYRAYLPGMGIFLALVSGIHIVFERRSHSKYIPVFFVVLALVFSVTAYKRNTVWKSRISLWEDSAKKAPANPRAHLNLGIAYLDSEDADKAIAHFVEALKFLPTSYEDIFVAETHYNLGMAYDAKGQAAEAVAHYQNALKLNLKEPGLFYRLGMASSKKGRTKEALRYLETAVEVSPGFAEAYNSMGNVYRSIGNLDSAVEKYSKAIALRPDMPEAYNNIGSAYLEKGMPDKAIEHLSVAIKLKPDYAKAHFNLANAYASKGLTGPAVEHYKKAIELKPDYAGAYYNLAVIYQKMGLGAEAAFLFRKAEGLKNRPQK